MEQRQAIDPKGTLQFEQAFEMYACTDLTGARYLNVELLLPALYVCGFNPTPKELEAEGMPWLRPSREDPFPGSLHPPLNLDNFIHLCLRLAHEQHSFESLAADCFSYLDPEQKGYVAYNDVVALLQLQLQHITEEEEEEVAALISSFTEAREGIWVVSYRELLGTLFAEAHERQRHAMVDAAIDSRMAIAEEERTERHTIIGKEREALEVACEVFEAQQMQRESIADQWDQVFSLLMEMSAAEERFFRDEVDSRSFLEDDEQEEFSRMHQASEESLRAVEEARLELLRAQQEEEEERQRSKRAQESHEASEVEKQEKVEAKKGCC